MSAINIRGSLAAFLQDYTRRFDPTSGWIYEFNYEGVSEPEMEALQNFYVQGGCTCVLHYRRGISTLFVEDATQQFTLDNWEVVGNEESRDVLSHPFVVRIATNDQISNIRKAVDEFSVSDTIAPIFTNSIFDSLSAGNKTFLGRIVGLMLRGTTDYRRGLYVLRHTTNAPSRWQSNISDFGVDSIYTTSQLLSEVQNSGLWINPMPGRLVYKIGVIPVPTFIPFYQWGWLKCGATETTSANNRITISTDYILEQWTTDLYSLF